MSNAIDAMKVSYPQPVCNITNFEKWAILSSAALSRTLMPPILTPMLTPMNQSLVDLQAMMAPLWHQKATGLIRQAPTTIGRQVEQPLLLQSTLGKVSSYYS